VTPAEWARAQFAPRQEAPQRNEVQFDCDFNGRLPVNGWEIGRIGQNLGRDFREQFQPGWRIVRGRVRLSVWLERVEVKHADDVR
jgi:hypothetical protein